MSGIGIELELGFLLGLQLIGSEVFAAFEVETPVWKKILKWSIIIAITLGLHGVIGHWAIAVPAVAAIIGGAVHWAWCRKHGIHPLNATPRRRYYELRGWNWPD